MTEEAKRKLMRLTRSQLNPIGKLVYDFCESNGESRKECLLTAVLAEDCFINLKQAEEWIRSKKRSRLSDYKKALGSKRSHW